MVKAWAVAASVLFFATTMVRAADPTPASTPSSPASSATPESPCGPFPKLYKEIIWHWMQGNLVDAESAKIEWQADPKCSDLGQNGQHEYGWLVNFSVNSRNRFGAYTGKQQHGVLIRDGQVVKGIGFGY
jgi:hypothetical protein